MDANFQRASELVNVPDDVILDMYNKLRPNRSTKKELILMARNFFRNTAHLTVPNWYLRLQKFMKKWQFFEAIASVDTGNSTTEVCIGSVGEN